MNFLGHPWQIWAAALIAVSVKITMPGAPKSLTSRLISVFVALLSGVILYMPVVEMVGWGVGMHVPVAIIISLTAENFMRSLVDLSSDKEILREWLKDFLNKKESDK